MEYLHSGKDIREDEEMTIEKHRVFHGDLKPVCSLHSYENDPLRCYFKTNILVHIRDRNSGRPKAWLSDFDYSGEIAFNGTIPTHGSSTTYVAPEILRLRPGEQIGREIRRNMNEKGDIYSLGLTVFSVSLESRAFHQLVILAIMQLLTGQTPFINIEITHDTLKYEAEMDHSIYNMHCPKNNYSINDSLFDLLESCWAYNPTERPSSMAGFASRYRRIMLA